MSSHRDVITFQHANGDRTYQVALMSETKAALIRYIRRGRSRLLGRYPVRGYEDLVVGEDPGWLFLACDNGRVASVGPLTDNGLSEMVNRRYKAGGGGLENFRSHRIRHGTATLLVNNGMQLEELSRHMGHSSTRVTARYGNPTPESIGAHARGAMARSGLLQPATRRARRV